METKKIPRGPQLGMPPMTEAERLEWREYLRALGVIPAIGMEPWPPRLPETIKPSFFLLRRWVLWPVRRLVRRHLLP